MQENPKRAYACPEYVHASRVLECIKGKLLDINSCRVNPTSSGSHPTPLYGHYKKPKRLFYNGGRNIQDPLENNESKIDFTLKHPQVKCYLVGTCFGLDL